MFTAYGAIDLSLKQRNASRKKLSNGIFLGFRSADASLFNALRTLKLLTGLRKIIGVIGAIKEAVVIMALAIQNLQALPQQPGLIQPISFLGTTVIATGHQSKRTGT